MIDNFFIANNETMRQKHKICSLCHYRVDSKDDVRLKCKHIYHKECIISMKYNECPTCKSSLEGSRIGKKNLHELNVYANRSTHHKILEVIVIIVKFFLICIFVTLLFGTLIQYRIQYLNQLNIGLGHKYPELECEINYPYRCRKIMPVVYHLINFIYHIDDLELKIIDR